MVNSHNLSSIIVKKRLSENILEKKRKAREYEKKIIYIIEPGDLYEITNCLDGCCGISRDKNNSNEDIEIKGDGWYEHGYVQGVYKTKEEKIKFLKSYPFEINDKRIEDILNS